MAMPWHLSDDDEAWPTPIHSTLELSNYPEAPSTLKAKDSRARILSEPSPPNSLQAIKTVSLDWDGPNDVDNPRNWPKWKKIFHSAIPAIYSFGLYVQSKPIYNSFLELISAEPPVSQLSWPVCLLS